MFEVKVIRETEQPDGTISKQVVVTQILPEIPEDLERYAWNYWGSYLEIKEL